MLERQEGKRNATPQDIKYARGKLYDRRKKKQGALEGNKNADKQSGRFDHFESEGKSAEKVGDETGVSKTTSALDARDRVTVGKQGRPSLKRDNVTNKDSEEAERGNSALHQNSRLTQNYKL